MKNIFVTLLLGLFVFCSCSDAEKIFKGEVTFVEKPATDMLAGEKIVLDGLYDGYPIVFDSVISFVSFRYPDYFLANFNVNTGSHIGDFCRKGQGPDEFLSVSVLNTENNYDFWVYDYNKRHFVLANMLTGTLKKRIDFSTYKKKGTFPFARCFILNDSLLVAVNQPEQKNVNRDVMLPKYRIINYLTNEEIANYELYDEDLYNKLREGKNEVQLAENYRIKPDKNKIVGTMYGMFQINIIELKTGQIRGYRVIDTRGFDFVRIPNDDRYKAYSLVAVDDDFIYAMLDNFRTNAKPIIHVFNWEGIFVRILEFDQKGKNFDLDIVNKKLYFKDDEERENVWVYDVNYLYQ
jgi:hypothetical protein